MSENNEWISSPKEERTVVAIANFTPKQYSEEIPVTLLSFCVGDVLHTTHRCKNWYFGQFADSRGFSGIFPCNFVASLKQSSGRPASGDEYDPNDDPIVPEMARVLREWHPIWKQKFARSHASFHEIRGMMLEMLKIRREILFSGKVTFERMQELKQRSIDLIALGNSKLGLDVIVRDAKGNSVNPEKISAVELFHLHEKVAVRTKTRKETRISIPPLARASASNHIKSYKLAVKLSAFAMSVNLKHRYQLLITLYHRDHAANMVQFTEPLAIEWSSRDSFLRFDDMDCSDAVVFTDINGRDLEKERRPHVVVFLIRIGPMDAGGDVKKRSAMTHNSDLRRPIGVAVKDISEIIVPTPEGCRNFYLEDVIVPFILCGERECLYDTLLKSFGSKPPISKEKNPEVSLSMRLFDHAAEESMALQERSAHEGRKFGFPEVVLPEYFRSDIFVTIISAELAKTKNVEVNVSVHDDEGNRIEVRIFRCNANTNKYVLKSSIFLQEIIYLGAGAEPISEFRSVVYYQQEKPKWMETMRIELSPDLFAKTHLRFTMRHRSRTEAKEKIADVPFSVSYLPLVEPKSTILRDDRYDLTVIRLTSAGEKNWHDRDISYTDEAQGMFNLRSSISEGMKLTTKKYTVNLKEVLRVSTIICSTKLTYDIHLMSLLKWKENLSNVKSVLRDLQRVNTAEIVKFLRDTLDAIFGILMHFADTVDNDEEVFDALVHVISKMNEVQYEHFKSVMNSYIEESFHATLAHRKLLRMLNIVIKKRSELQNVMKATYFMFKFIVKSRNLYVECLMPDASSNDEFEEEVVEVYRSMADLMKRTEPEAQVSQCFCLKHLPQATADLVTVIKPATLSACWGGILSNVKRSQRSTQFLTTMREIVTSPLFTSTDARSIILPVMCRKIAERLTLEHETKLKTAQKAMKLLGTEDFKTVDDGMAEEMELTVKLLGDILQFLWQSKDQGVEADVHLLADELLMPVVKLIFGLPSGDRFQQIMEFLVVILTSLLRQMSTHHFKCFFDKMNEKVLQEFLIELLNLFVNLITNPVFPKQWGDMMILRSSVILKTVKCIGATMKEQFLQNMVVQLWENYFKCAVQFITDPALQLETFNPTKRNKIVSRYKDMRKSMADEVRTMWLSLEMQKIRFIPRIVKDFLEMTLVPDPELRRETLPIFFDMMLCEFCSPPPPGETEKIPIRGSFREFHDEVIAQLDCLVEGGKGDDHYKHSFKEILGDLCAKHQDLKKTGTAFVETVSSLMEKLLMFRGAASEESVNNVMSCAEILLEFFGEIKQWKLHLKYLYKLFDLHKAHGNQAEAAYTLLEHYRLLSWKKSLLPDVLAPPKCAFDARSCKTYEQLKFRVAHEAMSLFEEAMMWEPAIEICKDLCKHCAEHTFNYVQLSNVLERQAAYCKNIVQKERFHAEYYRVAFYGRGFPAFLQNKEFICRGSVFEKLSDFQTRIMNQFPNAEIMKKLDEPSQEKMDSPCQMIQVNQVNPVENPNLFGGRTDINNKILDYYQHNEISNFVYSRLERNAQGATSSNDFARLWKEKTFLVTRKKLPGKCITVWFPVVEKTRELLKPIQTAEEAMKDDNRKLTALIKLLRDHQLNRTQPSPSTMNDLNLMLTGRLDAAVMGGMKNYEEYMLISFQAFLTAEYLEMNPEDLPNVEALKKLIVSTVELLGDLLRIKGQYLEEGIRGWYDRLCECFSELRMHVLADYPDFLSESMRSAAVEMGNSNVSVAQSAPESVNTNRHSGSWMESQSGQNIVQRASTNVFNTLRRAKPKKSMSRMTSGDATSHWYAVEGRNNAIRRRSSIEPEGELLHHVNNVRASCFELPANAAPPLPQKMGNRNSEGQMSSSSSSSNL
ncbi:unnamed protein product [Notodromas monacha]|uniref:Dedicator of cytokinesis protein 1 n=1 Tax=Notodromas monacha TaxID=399045 RepID=A0A7R9BIS8_9CRUS|nr:unnamed protein product [Notodromas monacha]CAG0915482.1 unnamed protein product [Notodromas monacha]